MDVDGFSQFGRDLFIDRRQEDVTAHRSAELLECFSASTQRIPTTRRRDVTARRY
jgi:hypothetical protein